jgi:hypothetical protein
MNTNIVSTVILSLGIAIAGFSIGKGIITFKKLDQIVTVRGLAERTVKSNEGVISITFSESGDDPAAMAKRFLKNEKDFLAYLQTNDFALEEIEIRPQNLNDQRSYGGKNMAPFALSQTFVIKTSKLDSIDNFKVKASELSQNGFLPSSTNIRYYFTALNEIKPEMLKLATQNARQAADSFANDSGASVGGIKSASQGLFTIVTPFSEYDDGSLMKKVRVVTSVNFQLLD